MLHPIAPSDSHAPLTPVASAVTGQAGAHPSSAPQRRVERVVTATEAVSSTSSKRAKFSQPVFSEAPRAQLQSNAPVRSSPNGAPPRAWNGTGLDELDGRAVVSGTGPKSPSK